MSASPSEIVDVHAPGWPGIAPRWTSSAKTGVGSAHNRSSLVWFTISHGILNEVYYPRVDQACIRDLGLIVTDGVEFFSEEKRDSTSEIAWLAPGAPAYRIVNTCKSGRYRIEKEVVADPRHDAVLQRIRFSALSGGLEDYRVHVLLAPHLTNRGSDNTAWVGDYKGEPMLLASRETAALALACGVPWKARSAGFVGVSDGWQDLHQHKRMLWRYERADSGNVALVGEIDLSAGGGEFELALGFGATPDEAGNRALSSLRRGFSEAYEEFAEGWIEWQRGLLDLERVYTARPTLYRASTAVLRLHDAKRFHGGTIASLSIPWGFFRSDDDIGGYHLVWPRDLVETAAGLLAAGAVDDARNVLFYLESIQESDGHWPQNMWLDGKPYWTGLQMDETAFPILLVRLLEVNGALSPQDLRRFWPMVHRAATFLAMNGPVTDEDRWEENAGYTPFTLAVEITGLLSAADVARRVGETSLAAYLEQTADFWNESIEDWLYVSDTDLARQVGVSGYYIRIMPPDPDGDVNAHRLVTVRNSFRELDVPADHLISQDALALVRFGLRSAEDPRIVDTVRVIDALLKTETPVGPCWHRYNYDGYGEHEDGGPFDGSGVGRAWPLLVGERAHYEIAAGRMGEARRLLQTFAAFANPGEMLPEQVWDAADVPERELYLGKPSGSAMPLVWAHSEYIKLLRSIREGRVFDMPTLTTERYLKRKTVPTHSYWQFNAKISSLPQGRVLRIAVHAAATVRWTADGWQSTRDEVAKDSGVGVQYIDLPTKDLPPETSIEFTFHWTAADRWENRNFVVRVRP